MVRGPRRQRAAARLGPRRRLALRTARGAGRRAALELVEPALERIGQPGLEERIAVELEARRSVDGGREAVRDGVQGGFAHDRSPFAAGARSSSSSASSASARAPRSLGAYSKTESPFDCASSMRT